MYHLIDILSTIYSVYSVIDMLTVHLCWFQKMSKSVPNSCSIVEDGLCVTYIIAHPAILEDACITYIIYTLV